MCFRLYGTGRVSPPCNAQPQSHGAHRAARFSPVRAAEPAQNNHPHPARGPSGIGLPTKLLHIQSTIVLYFTWPRLYFGHPDVASRPSFPSLGTHTLPHPPPSGQTPNTSVPSCLPLSVQTRPFAARQDRVEGAHAAREEPICKGVQCALLAMVGPVAPVRKFDYTVIMKSQSLATLVAVAASLQGVVATGWHNAPIFTCPGKTPIDKCEPQQWGGWNWGDLNLGNFDHYGGFDFSGGWSCKSSFGGRKRDALLPRTFGSKCISGTAHSEKSSCPKIKASSVDKFSITHLQVSVEFDCELEFHYTLPNKSVCKQKSHCKKTGTTVKNTQCGGATDVTVVYPKPPKGGKDKCDIGIHSIGFDCPTTTATASTVASTTTEAPVETTPTAPETTEVPETTTDVEETPTLTTLAPETTDVEETPTASTEAPETTEAPGTTEETPTASTEAPETTEAPGTTDVEETPTASTEAPETTEAPGTTDVEETPTATETEVTLTTVVTDVTVTSCPVTRTHITSGVTSIETTLTTSTVVLTSTKTFCPKCTGRPTHTKPSGPEETTDVPETTEGAEPTDVPGTTDVVEPTNTDTIAPPQTTDNTSPGGDSGLPCPPVLPGCIKTWLPTECKSNSDIGCFCPKPEFTKNLFDCLASFGATQEEINDAAEYFQGLCAPYVPTNPGIVTDCPDKGEQTKAPHTVPVTTIVVETTVTVPCEPTGTATESTFTVTTISTEVTVPQVILTTTNSQVIVVTGPASVEATQTAPAPVYTTPAGEVPAGFTTSRTGAAAGTGTGGLPQPTQPPFVPGSASKSAVSAGVLGAVMAFVALVV
ncbi:hypothetical protein V497_06062 [Pseudogymnoascus sp. VKM F-4516 (FW-969)]|nr:hypothetical protein V497_06062 [Pseudogymnoascus sp. VKM F-4516 (FW-969)]